MMKKIKATFAGLCIAGAVVFGMPSNNALAANTPNVGSSAEDVIICNEIIIIITDDAIIIVCL